MDARILLVEDDASIREATKLGLEMHGFVVDTASDGDEAVQRFSSAAPRPDLVLLDVMLPKRDGLDVCREVRRSSMVPIVMLTARNDTIDIVVGLEAGADDYVTKPFELRELTARIRAVLRRTTGTADVRTIRHGDVELELDAHSVTRRGEAVAVTATEFKLLHELLSHPRQVFTRQLLLELVWGYDYLGDSRLVDVAVQRLRAKIEDDPGQPAHIVTIRGVGYRAG